MCQRIADKQKQNSHTVVTVPKSNRKIVGGNIDTPTITYTLMTWYRHFNKKSGEVKIVA
jgi:hypothetical protein